jgi:hypothetical protein
MARTLVEKSVVDVDDVDDDDDVNFFFFFFFPDNDIDDDDIDDVVGGLRGGEFRVLACEHTGSKDPRWRAPVLWSFSIQTATNINTNWINISAGCKKAAI